MHEIQTFKKRNKFCQANVNIKNWWICRKCKFNWIQIEIFLKYKNQRNEIKISAVDELCSANATQTSWPFHFDGVSSAKLNM